MSVADSYFDELFRNNDDPWAFKKRWYERRKRALTLAALPRERYRAIFEPGCANGELSADLAERCDTLVCC
ncbi:SAM-dependent methyltransferase, partial [Pseudomonas syringae pv. actinidiae]|nr:SAM-dependent methyltransferase [Pseudomonas syringae pv. actinidiae]